MSAPFSSVSGTTRFNSSALSKAQRKAPSVNHEFPPDSHSGADSKTTTDAPLRAAARAAHKAAFPAPTTATLVVIRIGAL